MLTTARIHAALALCLLVTVASADTYRLLITGSPPGPDNTNPATWLGVKQFEMNAGILSNLPEIPREQVSDPAGLAFNAAGQLFVGNRHGNNMPSSVSRFDYDAGTATYSAGGTISGNSLLGVHEVTFNPVSGELFAANVNGPISRFTFDGGGNAVANGTLGGGSLRGLAVSADGMRLYASGASNSIQTFDLTTGMLVNTFAVPGASGLHNMSMGPGGDLYVSDINADGVFRLGFDGNGLPVFDSFIGGVDDALDVGFSPDESEMLVTGHRSHILARFTYDAMNDAWVSAGQTDLGIPLGAILTYVPEPSSVCLLAAAAALSGRRFARGK
ncbi:hypothetical protein RAS1_26220 [Phycisphaerae bacterium RAS1]|nr:hypothetical protein RAS1_26220 [Phycisphaerae bacterium RAS1]